MHWADTAEDAREIVLKLCRDKGVRMAVKSKSMATEEIDLNEALEHAGVTPVETDLGEYIIQLAHERPSHIIAPAIHKTKGQVAELISAVARKQLAADPEVLTAAARVLLREKFLQADMGITGANFAVAETGTVVLVTNEGNGRMVTTLPRIHVAVMGIEKVIPSMTDLMVFLALLARSATGQKLSSYTTLVRGPRQAGELEGPEEFHLILMDGGRARQIAGPLREALYCLRCGACLNVCPVYRQIGGHAYGHTYPGPIGILLTAMLKGDRSVKDLAHASSLCGACKDVCPVRIDIPRMLVELREQPRPREDRARVRAARLQGVPARSSCPRRRSRCRRRIGRLAQKPFVRNGQAAEPAALLREVDGHPRPAAHRRADLPRALEGSARDGHARGLPRPDPGGGREDAGPLRGADRDPPAATGGGRGGGAAADGRALAGGPRALSPGVRARGRRVPPGEDGRRGARRRARHRARASRRGTW